MERLDKMVLLAFFLIFYVLLYALDLLELPFKSLAYCVYDVSTSVRNTLSYWIKLWSHAEIPSFLSINIIWNEDS